MWNHHNPLKNQKHYDYYVRCVERFRKLLVSKEHKLFVMISGNISDELRNNIIEFNKSFSKYTQNYKLLVICAQSSQSKQYHAFTHHDEIDFLELHTLSKSNGIRFANSKDNVYLRKIITSTYTFDLE